MSSTFWIILAISLLSIPCSILGSFLILRKQIMLIEALAYAVLPGIVIAHLFDSNTIVQICIAGFIAFVASQLMNFLFNKTKLYSDSVIGVTYTSLFALGLLIINIFELNNELDPEMILFGEMINLPFDHLYFKSINLGPKAIWVLGFLNIITLMTVLLGYTQFKINSFDRTFVKTLGGFTLFLDGILLGLVSITTVAAFDLVGSVLIIGLFTLPPAAAYIQTHRLSKMIVFSVLIGIIGSILGYYLSALLNISSSSCILLTLGIIFLISLLSSFKHLNKT